MTFDDLTFFDLLAWAAALLANAVCFMLIVMRGQR